MGLRRGLARGRLCCEVLEAESGVGGPFPGCACSWTKGSRFSLTAPCGPAVGHCAADPERPAPSEGHSWPCPLHWVCPPTLWGRGEGRRVRAAERPREAEPAAQGGAKAAGWAQTRGTRPGRSHLQWPRRGPAELPWGSCAGTGRGPTPRRWRAGEGRPAGSRAPEEVSPAWPRPALPTRAAQPRAGSKTSVVPA